MTSRRFTGTCLRVTMLAMLCGALSACALTDRIFSRSGSDSDAPREGRIPILTAEQVLAVGDGAQVPVSVPGPYVNASWPQTGGAPTHAMQHPDAGQLARLWRRSIGAGDGRDGRITGQPVLESGRIFAMDSRGDVSAFDADTGQQVWRRSLRSDRGRSRSGGFGGGLAVGEGRLYATSGSGLIAALNPATGAVLWEVEANIPVRSAPAVAEGRVYAVTDDNLLIALDASSGERLWSFQGITESARMMTAPAPAVFGDLVVGPFGSGELIGLDAGGGRPIWEDTLTRAGSLAPISTLNDIAGSPVIYDGVVYATSHSGVLAAISAATGERIWTLPAGGVHMPWLAGDVLFLVTGEGELIAVDRISGDLRWLTQLPAYRNPDRRRGRISWAGPILAGGRLVLASSEGEGRFHDPATGEHIGSFDPGDDVFVSPIVANRTVYIVTSGGDLVAFR